MNIKIRNVKIKKKSDFEKIFKDSALVLRRGNVFKLNQTGALIWKFIDKIPLRRIILLISKEKNMSEDEVEEMLRKFIEDLRKNDLIEFV